MPSSLASRLSAVVSSARSASRVSLAGQWVRLRDDRQHEVAHGARARGFFAGDVALPENGAAADEQCRDCSGACDDPEPVPHQEAPYPIPAAAALRAHRPLIEPAFEIVGERGGGFVSLLGPLAKGFQDDRVEVAAQRTRQRLSATTLLGNGGSMPTIASSSAPRESRCKRYGRSPVSSSNNITPSE